MIAGVVQRVAFRGGFYRVTLLAAETQPLTFDLLGNTVGWRFDSLGWFFAMVTVGAAGLPYGVTALDEALHGPQPTALQARSWNV